MLSILDKMNLPAEIWDYIIRFVIQNIDSKTLFSLLLTNKMLSAITLPLSEILRPTFLKEKNEDIYKDKKIRGLLKKIQSGNASYSINPNGRKEGRYQLYKKGELRLSCYYKHDLLHGEYKIIRNNGSTITGYYQNNKKYGIFTTTDKNNKITSEIIYSEKGKIMAKSKN